MRRLVRWIPSIACLVTLGAACDDGGAPQRRTGVVQAPASTPPVSSGQVLVLRLGDGVEVLGRQRLDRAPRARRTWPRHWAGRWETRSPSGAVLHGGRFRIPRRRHALFGAVGGPARAVDVELPRPVIWLRVPVSPEATRLVLFDDHGRRRLGEVAL